MKFFNKNFLVGLGCGVFLAFMVVTLRNYPTMEWFPDERPGNAHLQDYRLEVPPFPREVVADYNWTLQSLEGQGFKVSQAKGNVVFLNFWAPWCNPCIKEMPNIQRLYDALKEDGVVFACVSFGDTDQIKRFVKEKGFSLPVYTFKEMPPSCFNARAIPVTYILSPDGKVAFKHVGAAKWDDEQCVDFIKSLIPKSP